MRDHDALYIRTIGHFNEVSSQGLDVVHIRVLHVHSLGALFGSAAMVFRFRRWIRQLLGFVLASDAFRFPTRAQNGLVRSTLPTTLSQDSQEPTMLTGIEVVPSKDLRRRGARKPLLNIWEAAKLGDIKEVQSHINDRTDINNPNTHPSNWGTPLSVAARYGQSEVVELLLKNGAKPCGEIGWYTETALQVAAAGGHLTIVRYLCHHGAELNTLQSSFTAVYAALSNGHSNVVEFLIHNGARDPWLTLYCTTMARSMIDEVVDMLPPPLQAGQSAGDLEPIAFRFWWCEHVYESHCIIADLDESRTTLEASLSKTEKAMRAFQKLVKSFETIRLLAPTSEEDDIDFPERFLSTLCAGVTERGFEYSVAYLPSINLCLRLLKAVKWAPQELRLQDFSPICSRNERIALNRICKIITHLTPSGEPCWHVAKS